MQQSNYFPFYDYDLLPKSYSEEPSQALLFDGVSLTVPTISKKKLVFGGAVNKLGGKDEPFKIPFDRIMSFNVHCSKPAVKKRVRFKCCAIDACTNQEFASIHLRFISSAEFPIAPNYGLEKDTVFFPLVEDCGAIDCCRLIKGLAKYINNQNENYPVIAIASTEGSVWYLDIEAKNAGQDFIVAAAENLLVTEKTPNFNEVLTAKKIARWFDNPLVTDCDPDKPMEILEIIYKEFVPHYSSGGIGASNGSVPENVYDVTHNILPIVFDPAVPQSLAAKTAILNILKCEGMAATVKEFMAIDGKETCTDGPVHTYCITRTDLGDPAGLADVKADYPAFIQAGLTSHVGATGVSGLSTYSVSFLNQLTAPTPAVNATIPDVIVSGSCFGECLSGDCPALTPCSNC